MQPERKSPKDGLHPSKGEGGPDTGWSFMGERAAGGSQDPGRCGDAPPAWPAALSWARTRSRVSPCFESRMSWPLSRMQLPPVPLSLDVALTSTGVGSGN